MRCEEAQIILEERGWEEAPGAVRTHVAACSECAAYVRDWAAMRRAFDSLRAEPVAEPSLGFAARLRRHLEQAPAPLVQDLLEIAGRRFVEATSVLALVALLALALPSSGPLRGPTTDELLLQAQSEVTMATADPMIYGFESGFSSPLTEAGENGENTSR
jgi:anti-sigma factor RsiW